MVIRFSVIFCSIFLKFYQLLGSVLKIVVAVRVWKINSFKLVVTIWQPNTNSMCVEMGEGAILGGKAISIMLGRFSEMEKEKLIFILNNWKTVSLTAAPECSQSIFRMFRALAPTPGVKLGFKIFFLSSAKRA